MNCVNYASSNSFSPNNSISISVNNSNFTSVLIKTACQANLGAKRDFTGPKK